MQQSPKSQVCFTTFIIDAVIDKISSLTSQEAESLRDAMSNLSTLSTKCFNTREQMLNESHFDYLRVFIETMYNKCSESERRLLEGFGSHFRFLTDGGKDCRCCEESGSDMEYEEM